MTFVRQDKNGDWFVCSKTSSNHASRKYKKSGRIRKGDEHCTYKNFYLIKYGHPANGYAILGLVHFPKEFIGRRIQFKVEVLK